MFVNKFLALFWSDACVACQMIVQLVAIMPTPTATLIPTAAVMHSSHLYRGHRYYIRCSEYATTCNTVGVRICENAFGRTLMLKCHNFVLKSKTTIVYVA